MSEIYLRQKKVSQLTRVTEENDDAGVAGRVPRPMKKRFGSTRPASSTQYPLGRDRLDMQAASLTAELSGIR